MLKIVQHYFLTHFGPFYCQKKNVIFQTPVSEIYPQLAPRQLGLYKTEAITNS